MDSLRKTGLVAWALCGGLLGVGFLSHFLWPLGILGIAYFFYLAQQTGSYRQIALGGLVAWTIKSLAALIWFLSVYPIEWLPFSLGKIELLIVIFYWVTNSLWLGVGGMVAAVLIKKMHALRMTTPVLILMSSLAWVSSELVGSFVFSIMTYGAGGAITSAFSFGYVGYLLSQHEWLLQLARVYGVYSLSLCAVLLALGVLAGIRNKKWRVLVVGGAVFWVSGFIPVPSSSEADSYHSVLTIDTTIPISLSHTAEGRVKRQQILEQAMQSALSFSSDYIVLPEDTQYFNQSVSSQQEKNTFQFLHSNPRTIIVDTGRARVEEGAVLQAFTYNGRENTIDISHKRYLVPQGEFMPYFYATLLRLLGFASAIETIEKDISYVVGPLTNQRDSEKSTPGILYCFESVSPWGVKKIVEEKGEVPFIAHPISHGWFNEPTFLWKSLDSMLQVQAVWSQQYIVSAGAHMSGQVFTPQGEIVTPENIASGEYWTVRQSFIPVR
jgi:apolipoprotein N-acyltransferase